MPGHPISSNRSDYPAPAMCDVYQPLARCRQVYTKEAVDGPESSQVQLSVDTPGEVRLIGTSVSYAKRMRIGMSIM